LTWLVRIALLLLTIGGLILRCHGLKTRGVWWDEASIWAEALTGRHNAEEAPLFIWFERLTMRLLRRDDPVVLHVPVVICGVLTIPAAYRLGRVLAGVACGLATALLVTVAPVALYFSQEAKAYGLLILVTTLQLSFALELLDAWAPRTLVLLLGLTAAATATHLLALPFSLGIGGVLTLALLWRARAPIARPQWLIRALVLVVGGAAAIALGSSWTLATSVKPVMAGHYTGSLREFVRYILVHLTTFSIFVQSGSGRWQMRDQVAANFTGAALVGMVALLWRRQVARVALVLLPPVCVAIGLYLQLGDKSPWPWTRYATPMMVPLFLLGAAGLTALRRWWISLPLVLALASLNLRSQTGTPAWAREAPMNRLSPFDYTAQRIVELEEQLRGVIFVQQNSIYGDETDRQTALYAMSRADHLPLYWEHNGVMFRVPLLSGRGSVPVPILSDDGPVELPSGEYAVFDGWVKMGCAAFSGHLEPSPLAAPPNVRFVLCHWK
jgi:hypothetical protein